MACVISGGQTGVDQAALRAAGKAGLACGGWCPPGRVCESGTIPDCFPLKETPLERSPEAPDVPRSLRTEWNLRDSDATLIVRPAGGGEAGDPGTQWTARCAARYRRPLLACDPDAPRAADAVGRWLAEHAVRTLNVAGPSEAASPGIGDAAFRFLLAVFAGAIKQEAERCHG